MQLAVDLKIYDCKCNLIMFNSLLVASIIDR